MRPSISISMVLATTVVGFQSYANNIDTVNSRSLSENASAQKQSLALQISERYSDLELSLKAQISEKNLSTPVDKLSPTLYFQAGCRKRTLVIAR